MLASKNRLDSFSNVMSFECKGVLQLQIMHLYICKLSHNSADGTILWQKPSAFARAAQHVTFRGMLSQSLL